MRKRRTREHIIADLSVNHVERMVLRAGHVGQRVILDYGYDLLVLMFDSNGEVEPGVVLVQIKATDALRSVAGGREYALTVEWRDLEAWLDETNPVFLVLYDAPSDAAYWLHVQGDLAATQRSARQASIVVRLPRERVLTEAAIVEWQRIKVGAVERARRDHNEDS